MWALFIPGTFSDIHGKPEKRGRWVPSREHWHQHFVLMRLMRYFCLFLKEVWESTKLDPDHLSETTVAKILLEHQFAKNNSQWRFAKMLSSLTICKKIIDKNINLQKCCPELQFAKMWSGPTNCKCKSVVLNDDLQQQQNWPERKICKIVVQDDNLQKCCAWWDFAKMLSRTKVYKFYDKIWSARTICKYIVQKKNMQRMFSGATTCKKIVCNNNLHL